MILFVYLFISFLFIYIAFGAEEGAIYSWTTPLFIYISFTEIQNLVHLTSYYTY